MTKKTMKLIYFPLYASAYVIEIKLTEGRKEKSHNMVNATYLIAPLQAFVWAQ